MSARSSTSLRQRSGSPRSSLSSAVAFTAVKVAGAVYLIGLGLWTLFSRTAETEIALGGERNLRRAFAQGIVVNVLNPKTALFFLAFLPQFVDPDAAHPALQIAFLGVLFALLGLVTDSLWALAAGTAGGVLRRSRRFARVQRYVTGNRVHRARRRDGARRRRRGLTSPMRVLRHALAICLLPGTRRRHRARPRSCGSRGPSPSAGICRTGCSRACGARHGRSRGRRSLVAWTIALFARVGRGTLAPWDATVDPRRRRAVPARPQPNDQRRPLPPARRGDAARLAGAPRLVRGSRGSQCDLHAARRASRASFAGTAPRTSATEPRCRAGRVSCLAAGGGQLSRRRRRRSAARGSPRRRVGISASSRSTSSNAPGRGGEQPPLDLLGRVELERAPA